MPTEFEPVVAAEGSSAQLLTIAESEEESEEHEGMGLEGSQTPSVSDAEMLEMDEDEDEEEMEDVFSELFPFTLPTIESSEKYVELSPIEQARQHRLDFDLKIPKCILKHGEIEQLFTVFDLIDTKNSGYIGTRGVTMVFRSMGIEPSPAEVGAAIAAVSKHKKVSFKEFLTLIKNKVEERDDIQGLRKGFDSMDFRKRKVLTYKELKIAAKLLGENLDREEGEEMIRQSDKDGDGVINFDDFCKTLNKINIYI